MPAPLQPNISNLAVIGDQRSCALIDKEGTVAWYCLWRFDQPSLFSLLIDEEGGYWQVLAAGKKFKQRQYNDDTAVLETIFDVDGGELRMLDFMPADTFSGLCRIVSPSPVDVTLQIAPTPNYGRSTARLRFNKKTNIVSDDVSEYYIHSSHPIEINDGIVSTTIAAGQDGWCILVDDARCLQHCNRDNIFEALAKTKNKWKSIMANIAYDGAYKKAFYQSYKALQLVTHASSGGMLAAATTSLPEVIGGSRNYDYRYVWLRDTAMNVSALTRAQSKGGEAEKFLDFLCAARNTNKKNLFVPFYDLDTKAAPGETLLAGTGYKKSTPIRIGNGAYEQLQLDGQGNVLLAAKQVYARDASKPHWKTIVQTADYLVDNWNRKDHGIWEEGKQEHYTSSKILVAKSLEFLAEHADDEQQDKKWRNAASKIRQFVDENCMTADGAYAVYAGSNIVDVTAALYPVWAYDDHNSKAMIKTIEKIESNFKDGDLYRRYLVDSDSEKEGVFLAASLWMAQYYVVANNTAKARIIIDAVLSFSTDLGFLPEEGDVQTGELLGNIPQTFVHASLMGAILDYNQAINGTT